MAILKLNGLVKLNILHHLLMKTFQVLDVAVANVPEELDYRIDCLRVEEDNELCKINLDYQLSIL